MRELTHALRVAQEASTDALILRRRLALDDDGLFDFGDGLVGICFTVKSVKDAVSFFSAILVTKPSWRFGRELC